MLAEEGSTLHPVVQICVACAAETGLLEVRGYNLVAGDVPVADFWAQSPHDETGSCIPAGPVTPLDVLLSCSSLRPSVRTQFLLAWLFSGGLNFTLIAL